MKWLFCSIIMLFAINGYSQDKDPLHLFDSTQKSATFDSIYKDVKGALSAMADGLKITVDHMWGILVKQQLVNSIVNLICFLAAIPLLLVFIKGMKNKGQYEDYPSTMAIISLCVAIILFGYFLCDIYGTITGFFNPEYGAFKEVIKHIE